MVSSHRTNVHAITIGRPNLDDTPGTGDLELHQHSEGVEARLTVEAGALDEVVGRLHAAGVETLTVTPPSLDDLFLDAYQNSGNG